MIRPLLAAAALLLIAGGCRSAQAGTGAPVDAPPAARQLRFYCERSTTNFAWSYIHRGLYVDPDGGVYRFEHARGDQPLLQVPKDSITGPVLLARYAPGRRRVGAVPAAEMARRYAQALEARGGTLTEPVRRGADMGATLNRCWLPDRAGIYREVLLRQRGDQERENRSPAAAALSDWLDSLANRSL